MSVAKLEGLYPSPEAAATFAAARKLVEQGHFRGHERVIAFSTGAGLKHTELIDLDLPVLDPNDPEVGRHIA